jgi:CBS domain-containing protein
MYNFGSQAFFIVCTYPVSSYLFCEEADMNTIEEILQEKGKTVYSVGPHATMMEALKIMTANKIGAVLILEGNKIHGIFSERDCVQNLADLTDCSLQAPITDFMTSPVYYITPDQTLDDCMAIMTSKRLRHLPVIQGEELVGLISIGDVVKKILSERDERIKDLENFLWVNLI